MDNNNQERTKRYVKEHTRKKRWHKVMITLASLVVFWVTYSLIIPGISWEKTLICEKKEHKHTDACYEIVETEDEKILTCDKKEHKHDDSCYEEKQTLVCDKEEHDGHHHSDECYKTEKTLICELEEGAEHTHDDSCYKEEKILVCDKKETEGHHHSDACYKTEKVLKCHEEEHVHDDSCYTVEKGSKKKVLVCELEEHEHTDACFDAPPSSDPGYYCGKIAHKHTKECYFSDGTLRCTIEEHEHTDACKINPNADTESPASWEHTMSGVKLTGKWSDDLIAIAKTQLGYRESTENYILNDAGKKKGYSRYGAWYGDPYGDWCAMFVSFCLNYADVDKAAFPQEANCARWIELLKKDKYDVDGKSAYRTADKYEPVPGDIIFFDWGGDGENLENGSADHIGIVEKVKYKEDGKTIKEIITIEGNAGNMVQERTYEPGDHCILGYGVLPKNPDYDEYKISEHTITSEAAEDGAVVKITGNLPAEAVAKITLNKKLTEEEYAEYFDDDLANKIDTAVSYDIKIMVNDKEWQPDDSVDVDIVKPDIEIENEKFFGVLHVDDHKNDIEEIDADVKKNGNVTFTAECFSEYILYTYTVDFHNGDIVFSITDGESIMLSDLFERLGIERSIEDVVNVYFSNPEYVSVEKEGDDWKLTAIQAFDTEEKLTIEFNDGEIYEIIVTDAKITCWQKVTSIDSGKVYLIVANNNKALTNNSNNTSTTVTITERQDNPGYYDINAGDTTKWTIASSGSNYTVKNGNNYLRMSNTNLFGTDTRNISISQSGGSWNIKRSDQNYYLTYSNNAFNRTNNNPGYNLTLYKQVEIDDGGGDNPVGPGDPTDLENRPPDHSKHIDAFRDGVDNPDTTLDNQEGLDLTDLYRLYLNVGPESTLDDVDMLLVIDISNSMKNDSGKDATDILGGTNVFRMAALNSLLNGLDRAGNNNQTTMYNNGLVSKVLALNPNNQVAVCAFGTAGYQVYGWSSTGQVVNGNQLNTTEVDNLGTSTGGGTNYVAALQEARTLLNANRNDGRKKVMVFLSDGAPTFHYNGLDDHTRGGTGNTTSNETATATNNAIDAFKNLYRNDITSGQLSIYSIGIGSGFTDTYLKRLSTDNTVYTSLNFQQVINHIDDKITRGVGHYSNLKIVDVLSDDVDFYSDQLDLVVERVPEKSAGTRVVMYRNGAITTEGRDYLKDNGVNVDYNNKTVSVEFKDNYQEEGGYIYRVSFNVKTTQHAYDTYAQNVAQNTNGYGGVKGDLNTDYDENHTSSDQPGFYSNVTAVISSDNKTIQQQGALLEYTQSRSGVAGDTKYTPYTKPVIQVSLTEAKVKKVWADGNDKHTRDTVTVSLYRKNKDAQQNPETDPKVGEVVLNTENNWQHTFENLVCGVDHGYEYYIRETACSTDHYNASDPVYDDQTNTWTITNTPTFGKIKIQKVDQSHQSIEYEGATFEIYSDETLNTKIGTFTTNADGQFEVENLEIGNGTSYWIVETNAPEGYHMLLGPHMFTVTFKENNEPTFTVPTEEKFLYLDQDEEENDILCFMNSSGQELPHTGGMGTTILYILGGTLIVFALICGFILRRRRERRED